jgi:hypothetical protein
MLSISSCPCRRYPPYGRYNRGRWPRNPSLSEVEPVSLNAANSRRERVGQGRRPGRHFRRGQPVSPDRDWPISGLRRQSRGKLKTIPTAPGNRSCVGLRGGAGRTQTGNQAIMEPEAIHDGGRRIIAQSLGRQDCGPIDKGQPAPAPSDLGERLNAARYDPRPRRAPWLREENGVPGLLFERRLGLGLMQDSLDGRERLRVPR